MQITYGLLCAADGCPVAIEVFKGQTSDPKTVRSQINKLRQRFKIRRIAVVGDRGMITTARIRNDFEPLSLDWISAFKTSDIRNLLKSSKNQPARLNPKTLVPGAVAEITSPDYPNERLLVCFNPRLKEERARKREDLLRVTEGILIEINRLAQSPKSRLKGRDAILRRIGREANKTKVEKHFHVTVQENGLTWSRREDSIEQEGQIDGIYVMRTSLPSDAMTQHQSVEACKSLANVEHAFRNCKTARLHLRPIYVYSEKRVRVHVFLVMLAWYVEWHIRQRLAPILVQDEAPETARAQRSSPVKMVKVSEKDMQKAQKKINEDGYQFTPWQQCWQTYQHSESIRYTYPDTRSNHSTSILSPPRGRQKPCNDSVSTQIKLLPYNLQVESKQKPCIHWTITKSAAGSSG